MEGGPDPTIGEKSEGVVPLTVTREEGPTEQPELVELVDSPTAFPEKGALVESILPRDASEVTPLTDAAPSIPLETLVET